MREDECGNCGHDHAAANVCGVVECSKCRATPPTPVFPYASAGEIAAARDLFGTDEIEIDDGARVARAEHHVWVQAWVYVNIEEIES